MLNDYSVYFGKNQLEAIKEGLRGEEKEYFKELVQDTIATIKKTPTIYETDGQGKEAIVYLHYFIGGFDWYITELEHNNEELQCFGLADLGEPELGYISLQELREHAELDLHWKPVALKEIM